MLSRLSSGNQPFWQRRPFTADSISRARSAGRPRVAQSTKYVPASGICSATCGARSQRPRFEEMQLFR